MFEKLKQLWSSLRLWQKIAVGIGAFLFLGIAGSLTSPSMSNGAQSGPPIGAE
jgi:hypothetical protein